jgi:hypothetical protein
MQTALFKPESGERTVTRDQILEGMRKFDQDHRGRERDTGLNWFVHENGQRYPPKRVLSLATGVPVHEFGGGKPTNDIFDNLGFEVLPVPTDDEAEPKLEQEAKAVKFTLERDLESALRLNIGQLEQGMKFIAVQKPIPSGRLDIEAEDKNGATVVIELKAGKADREAIGQILGYMGDLATGKNLVRGILVAGDFDLSAVAAARVVPHLQLRKYGFNFTFEHVGSEARATAAA